MGMIPLRPAFRSRLGAHDLRVRLLRSGYVPSHAILRVSHSAPNPSLTRSPGGCGRKRPFVPATASLHV
jgi:hypothetical protein